MAEGSLFIRPIGVLGPVRRPVLGSALASVIGMTIGLSLTLSLVEVRSAAAQNALGAGDRLDANHQVGSGRRNVPRAVEDFSARNNIVTGDVAGGIGFTGDVGYTSPRAFRGAVGSDAIIGFRSGSAFSAPSAVLGGLSADRFTLASRRGAIEFSRDTTPVDVQLTDFGNMHQRELLDARLVIDRATSSSSVFGQLERAAQGTALGRIDDGNGRPFAVVASPLTGMRYEPMVFGDVNPLEIGMYDWRRLAEDGDAGRLGDLPTGGSFPTLGMQDPLAAALAEEVAERRSASDAMTPVDRLDFSAEPNDPDERDPQRLDPNPDRMPSTRIDGALDLRDPATDYDRIVERMVVEFGERLIDDPTLRVDGDAEVRRRLREAIEKLSEDLSGRTERLPETTPEATPGDGDDPTALQTPGRPAPATSSPSGATPPATEGAAEQTPLTMDEIAGLLRHAQRIEDLSPMQRSRVDQLIARGQSELAEGDFFLAEKSFERALRLVPGHPLATAGMIHTQLGAGLYLSAALNLRRFFADSPEMIDARYADRLLPPQARLDAAVERVRDYVRRGGNDAPRYGLALAYLGQLTKRQDVTREGIEAIKGSDAEDALRLLLRKVWLNE